MQFPPLTQTNLPSLGGPGGGSPGLRCTGEETTSAQKLHTAYLTQMNPSAERHQDLHLADAGTEAKTGTFPRTE